jgi:hypothetical protein
VSTFSGEPRRAYLNVFIGGTDWLRERNFLRVELSSLGVAMYHSGRNTLRLVRAAREVLMSGACLRSRCRAGLIGVYRTDWDGGWRPSGDTPVATARAAAVMRASPLGCHG